MCLAVRWTSSRAESICAARLIYAGLVIMVISTGLLLGLTVFGVSLPVDQAGRAVPLWQDVVAAGVAVAAYSIFFSTPPHMMAWPVAVGMLAHALRWGALVVLGNSAATGALIACLVVGTILTRSRADCKCRLQLSASPPWFP